MKPRAPLYIATVFLALATTSPLASAQSVLTSPQASAPASRSEKDALLKEIEAAARSLGENDLPALRAVNGGQSSSEAGEEPVVALGGSLTATNVQIYRDPSGKTEEVAFGLAGACVSMRTLMDHYPNLLILRVPHPDHHGNSLVGATVGSGLVTFVMTPGPGPCASAVSIQTLAMAKARHLLR